MKLLFIWLDISETGRASFNHGIAGLAGYLKERGHNVGCISIRRVGEIESLLEVVEKECPDGIAFSIVTNQRKYLDVCAKAVRKGFRGLMIAGGVHATLNPDDVLDCEEIDGVCIGEGEIPLSILAECHDSNQEYLSVPCFWWRKDRGSSIEKIIRNDVCRYVTDASDFPFPDYSIFNVEEILRSTSGFFDIMISRGCPYSCTYCCNKCIRAVYHDKKHYFRIHPPAKAIDILVHYIHKYPSIKGFNFADDLLVWNKEWFLTFAEKYREGIGLPFTCNCRFELVDEEIARALSESGCAQVNLGLESGDEDLRGRLLKRRYTNRQIIKCAEILHESNIPFFTYNIFGFPFETKEQMQETVAINKAIRPSSGCAFFFYPFPKTELFNICVENDLLLKKSMFSVDGYCEKPVIKLSNCEESDCVSLQRELSLYFAARRLSRLSRIDSERFEAAVLKILLLQPSFFMKLLSKDSSIKRNLRKLMYRGMRQKTLKFKSGLTKSMLTGSPSS